MRNNYTMIIFDAVSRKISYIGASDGKGMEGKWRYEVEEGLSQQLVKVQTQKPFKTWAHQNIKFPHHRRIIPPHIDVRWGEERKMTKRFIWCSFPKCSLHSAFVTSPQPASESFHCWISEKGAKRFFFSFKKDSRTCPEQFLAIAQRRCRKSI